MNTAATPRYTAPGLRVESLDQMTDLAEKFSGYLEAGDLIVLDGELGAGKTFFVSAVGEALGVETEVTSPTFTIANSHTTQKSGLMLHHLDVYRLEAPTDLLSRLDLDDMLDDGVVMLEWGSRIQDYLEATYSKNILQIRIAHGDLDTASETVRSVSVSAYDQAMAERFTPVFGGFDA